MLLKYGARPNKYNSIHDAPMHYAWRPWDRIKKRAGGFQKQVKVLNTVRIIRMLVDQSAELNVVQGSLDTPLHIAAKFGPDELVLYLLQVL
jgi:hypothetical protein